LVEGATILLAFENRSMLLKEQTVQGTRPAVLEASTLINLGSRGAKYENDKYSSLCFWFDLIMVV
jgi:hypothetical protein